MAPSSSVTRQSSSPSSLMKSKDAIVPAEIRTIKSNNSLMSALTLDEDIAAANIKSTSVNYGGDSLLEMLATFKARRRQMPGGLSPAIHGPPTTRKHALRKSTEEESSSKFSRIKSPEKPLHRNTTHSPLSCTSPQTRALFRRATVASCEWPSSMPLTMPKRTSLNESPRGRNHTTTTEPRKRLSLSSIDALFVIGDSAASSMPLVMPVRRGSRDNFAISKKGKDNQKKRRGGKKPLGMPTGAKMKMPPPTSLNNRFTP